MSSLETTLKNWRNPKNHQGFLHLAIFRYLILSMVTVGADMVDPEGKNRVNTSSQFRMEGKSNFRMGIFGELFFKQESKCKK